METKHNFESSQDFSENNLLRGNSREDLDRDFGNNNEEKLRYVNAQLESQRASLKNLSSADSTNYGHEEINRMENIREYITHLETMQAELKSMLGHDAQNTTEQKPENTELETEIIDETDKIQ